MHYKVLVQIFFQCELLEKATQLVYDKYLRTKCLNLLSFYFSLEYRNYIKEKLGYEQFNIVALLFSYELFYLLFP